MSTNNTNNITVSLIVGMCKKTRGIGKEGNIPWFLKKDLKHFRETTSSTGGATSNGGTGGAGSTSIVIMGRKTWESIPSNKRPLKNRLNIVLTRNNADFIKQYANSIKELNSNSKEFNEVFTFSSLEGAIGYLKEENKNKNLKVFIIGGESLYQEALEKNIVDCLYITEVYTKDNKGFLDCDTFFPKFDEKIFKLTSVSAFNEENGTYFRFKKYVNYKTTIENGRIQLWKNEEENAYLEGLNSIINCGLERNDRTGVGTYSIFGMRWKYDLTDTFPILTTKRMFFRGIYAELALYISGKTDNKILQEQNIHIWDGNTSREFLDKRGLEHYNEGDMGETYGFNFRHFGAEYKGCQHDYTNCGFDQISNLLNLIKNDPCSRRMLINLWNPSTTHKAALPACLFQYQFYIDTKNNTLNAQIYLRSSDYFLANNWNVCTGALLIHMICNLRDINLTPGQLTVITGDTHIYKNHLDAVKENLMRTPRPFPKLIISELKETLEDYSFDDFTLIDYTPYKNISAPMAV